jgi:hypothetical protein
MCLRSLVRVSAAAVGLLELWLSHGNAPIVEAGPPPRPPVTAGPEVVDIYHSDPGHLWNRLYAAFHVQIGPDGRAYGRDEIDPLLWAESTYLLREPRHQEALALSDELLATSGEGLIHDPLRRAVFQHDLWAIFDWLADPDTSYRPEAARLAGQRQALRVRVARIIRKLALTADQIRALPDTYAAVVAAQVGPKRFDPSRTDAAFLPDDLLDLEGPWVLLEERGVPLFAPQHVIFTRGRSAFLVFLNLPGGRKATLDYLEKLEAFANPLSPGPPGGRPVLNPGLPQFPAGTQVALARRMMLVDAENKVTPTRLMESLQIRVYRDVPEVDPSNPQSIDLTVSRQQFVEFRLRRADLFDGKAGGLHAVDPREREHGVFRAHRQDPFDGPPDVFARSSRTILGSCQACHNTGPGIRSVLSYHRFGQLPPDVVAGDRPRQELGAVVWKQRHHSWGFLDGLKEGQRGQ